MNDTDLVIAERLRTAAAALAQVCDGARKRDDVGFSASDTAYGRAIAWTPAEQWTELDCLAVSALLHRYRGQLEGMGFSLADIPWVIDQVDRESNYREFKARAEAARELRMRDAYARNEITREQVRVVAPYLAWVEKRTVCIESPRDEALIAAIKACPNGRRWNGLARRWEAELSPANAKALLAIFSRFNFLVSGADQAILAQAQVATAAATVERPKADHVVIEGDRIVLRTPYNQEATAALKDALPGRRWDAANKVWTAPCTAEAARAVQALAERWGWRLGAAAARLAEIRAEAETFRAASKAADAELELRGLRDGAVPYSYQKAGVAYAVAKRRVLIADEMGIGKSLQALMTVVQLDAYPALVVAPKAVLRQWTREVGKFLEGRTASIVGLKGNAKRLARHGLTAGLGGDFVIVNYDILGRNLEAFKAHGFKALIVDECFVFDTLVQTDRGPLKIGDIVDNKIPVCVASFDFSRNEVVWRPVVRWLRRDRKKRLVTVRSEHGEFRCTEDHKVWTMEDGYVRAKELQVGIHHVCVLRKSGVSSRQGKVDGKVLQHFVCDQSSNVSAERQACTFGGAKKAADSQGMRVVWRGILLSILRKAGQWFSAFLQLPLFRKVEDVIAGEQGEVEKEYQECAGITDREEASCCCGTDAPHECGSRFHSKEGCRTEELQKGSWVSRSEWRKRKCVNSAVDLGAGVGFADRGCDKNKVSAGRVCDDSQFVQGGHCGHGTEDCHRGGRSVSSFQEATRAGSQKGCSVDVSWVVCVESDESGCDGTLRRDGTEDSFVYDLEVTEHHNYFANGTLVSNCHFIKNKKSARSQAVKDMAKQQGLQAVLLLTGTPVLNRPVELTHQLDVLGQLQGFGGFMTFAKRYANAKETKFGWDMTGASNLDELNRLLRERCMVRREKKDVLADLPAMQRTVVPVEVDDPKAYEQAMNDIVRWMAGQRGELPSESAYRAEMLVRIEGLRQLAVAAKYAATRDWLANWLDTAEGEKLVVFAHHRDAQEKLKADLADYGAVSISGGDSDDNRDAAVKRFWNDPTCRVIVCSIKAASVGLNLQCASNVAFVEFAWHAADMDQAEARCHRIGVQGAVTSYWIAGEDTFDEDMIALIESKRGVAHAAISGGEIEKQADVVAWFEKLIERKRTKEAWEGN
jgi:hypothetical protein